MVGEVGEVLGFGVVGKNIGSRRLVGVAVADAMVVAVNIAVECGRCVYVPAGGLADRCIGGHWVAVGHKVGGGGRGSTRRVDVEAEAVGSRTRRGFGRRMLVIVVDVGVRLVVDIDTATV